MNRDLLPAEERAALAALYRRTHEAQPPTAAPCAWPGVTCVAGHVTQVRWADRQLRGTLPPEVRFLTRLELLDLSRNQLHGPLPPELGHLKRLESLKLAENQLGGELPSRLRLLLSLRTLDLHRNRFGGPLPPGWSDLRSLEVLNLAENQLQGPLPASWARLSSLDMLDLSTNPLRGLLPAELVQLAALRTFHFQGTELMERGDDRFQAWLRRIPDVRSSGLLAVAAPPQVDGGRKAALLGLGAMGGGLTLAGVLLLPLGLLPGLLLAGGGAAAMGVAFSRWRALPRPADQTALPAPDSQAAAQLLREAHALYRSARADLPPELADQVAQLLAALEEVLPRIPRLAGGDPDAYTLRQIVRSYLPEAINRYRSLPPEYAVQQPLREGKTARQLLQEQLATLRGAVQDIAARTRPDARPLLVHGRFLEDRFAPRDEPPE